MAKNEEIEIRVKGPGEIKFGLVDSKGKVLLQRRVVVSGHPKIEARSHLPLALQTRDGEVSVVPVLIYQSTRKQQVTFADEKPAAFTARRCAKLRFSRVLVERAARAAANEGRPNGMMASVTPSGL
jgi:hypothetical protein